MDVVAQARTLTADERARLAELMLESLHETTDGEIEAAWSAEIERRVQAFQQGRMETYSADDVFAEARRLAP